MGLQAILVTAAAFSEPEWEAALAVQS
jgi:hypothetical protein